MINAHLRYEMKAKAFQFHTGMLAPGKDSADGAFTQEEREAEWKDFQAEHEKSFRLFFYAVDQVLSEATATQQAECDRLQGLANGLMQTNGNLEAECERLTQEIEQYRSLAEQVGATKAVSDRDEARATCEALRKELAEAKKDSARLDWLESVARWHDPENRVKVVFPISTVLHVTIRAAVDAVLSLDTARSSPESQGKAGT